LRDDWEGGWIIIKDEYKNMSYEEGDSSRPLKEYYMPE
jgi:hypothetical protein